MSLWFLFRIAVSVVAALLGLWLTFHEARSKKDRPLGLGLMAFALIQFLDTVGSVSEQLYEHVRYGSQWDIHHVAILDDARAIEAIDRDSQPLWRKSYAGVVRKTLHESIDGDSTAEVIVGLSGDDADGGRLFVYDADGALRWSYDAHTDYPYAGGSSNRTNIEDISVVRVPVSKPSHPRARNRKKDLVRIVALARDVNWFPARVVVLDEAGRLLAEYWHPGHLHGIQTAHTHDGGLRLVIHGLNNNLRLTKIADGSDNNFSVVFVLDPSKVEGQAPPRSAKTEPGSHLWYLAVLPQGEPITQVETVKQTDRSATLVGIWLRCGLIFYVDLAGNLQHVGAGDHANCPRSGTRLVSIGH